MFSWVTPNLRIFYGFKTQIANPCVLLIETDVFLLASTQLKNKFLTVLPVSYGSCKFLKNVFLRRRTSEILLS